MNAAEHILKALDLRLERYLNLLKTCRIEFSEEAVHDLRVATRRLLALTELVALIHSPSGYKKIRRMLKRRLDDFDVLRDVQVMITKVSKAGDALPAIAPFLDMLEKQEAALLEKAGKRIRKQKPDLLLGWFEDVRKGLRKQQDPDRISAVLFRAADLAYGRVLQRYDWMNNAQTSSIHRLRIAFKRFRYLLEMMAPFVPGLPSRILPDMQAYQTRLGDIQDMEVLLTGLSKFYEAGRKGTAVRKYYQNEYGKTIGIYWRGRGRVRKFWRPRPGGAFPWDSAIGIDDKGTAE